MKGWETGARGSMLGVLPLSAGIGWGLIGHPGEVAFCYFLYLCPRSNLGLVRPSPMQVASYLLL